MKFGPIEICREYHCREETSENRLTGIFRIGHEDLSLRLFSYGNLNAFNKHHSSEFIDYISLRTEHNWIVSLHNNLHVTASDNPARGRCNHNEAMHISSCELTSNLAIIGSEAWPPYAPVRQVFFRIQNSEQTLYNYKKFSELTSAEFVTNLCHELFYLYTRKMKIRSYLRIDKAFPPKIITDFSIEFDENLDLFQYWGRVHCVVGFFSALSGYRLSASNIRIARLSQDERKTASELEVRSDRYYLWQFQRKNREDAPKEIWAGYQFAGSADGEELQAFVACLKKWIERDGDGEWAASMELMLECMSLDHEVSSDRLLAACRWFEEIPGTKPFPAMKPEHVDAIAKEASAKASSLGYADIERRVAGSIKTISQETNKERYTRLVDNILDVFGANFLDKKFVNSLVEANNFQREDCPWSFRASGRKRNIEVW